MSPEEKTENVPEKKLSGFEKALSENTVATSVIIGSLIVAGSIILAAFMLRGGVTTSGVAKTVPTVAAGGKTKVTDRVDQPSLGSPNAPVTIYEFADFQCPFCQNFYKNSFAALKTKYIDTGKVRFVFRHFPLSFHVNAQISAEAAECANRQGQFESYYNMLFAKGSGDGTGLDTASLKLYANQIGLNMTLFNKCLDNHETKAVVLADQTEGTKIGVNGTPTFYINGTQLVGAQPLTAFDQAIEDALKK